MRESWKPYANRESVEKYSQLASYEDLVENDYNLNIPRYVDTFEAEETIDIGEKRKKYVELESKSKALDEKILAFFKELGI